MTNALGFFAFFGLMIAQALGALFSWRYPWLRRKDEHSGEVIPVVLAEPRPIPGQLRLH